MHARRRDLGKERLEDEVVIGVDELDLDLASALPRKCLSSENAAEAAADHEDFLLIHGQQSFFWKPYLRQCCTASSHGMKAFSATTSKTRGCPTSVENPSDWRFRFLG